jgi:hypothetical protein
MVLLSAFLPDLSLEYFSNVLQNSFFETRGFVTCGRMVR